MKKITIIILIVIFGTLSCSLFAQTSNLNKYDQVRQRSIYSDFKAMGIGDAVKILIVESTEAGNSAGTTESRGSSIGGDVGAGANNSSFSANASLGTDNSFKGSGSNTRKETIKTIFTSQVTGLDSSTGNYIIAGTRKTKIDGEEQTITLSGTIRPADIRADNSIYSYNIMNMELTIIGDGNATTMKKPGYITRFLRMLF